MVSIRTSVCYGTSRFIFDDLTMLDTLQRSKLFDDSKTLVDMPLKEDVETVRNAFREMLLRNPQPTKEELYTFIEKYLAEAGSELEISVPSDWNESPDFVQHLQDEELKWWFLHLNGVWKLLGRNIKPEVLKRPERTSLIPLSQPFVIPGDRFREIYYWDSFWTIGGLIVCGMKDTVKGMLENLTSLVDMYGFIPNGGRVYYINRSQPPLLTPMVNLYYEAFRDLDFIKEKLQTLEREHDFWMTERSIDVEDESGKKHRLARYCVNHPCPRPEGYIHDVNLTENMPDAYACCYYDYLAALTGGRAEQVYCDLASAAESGWDFSSRWLESESKSLSSIRTRSVIPVDLNTFLAWTELLLSKFHRLLGNSERSNVYRHTAVTRLDAIQSVMWDEKLGAWFDFDIERKSRTHEFYPSNVFPLLLLELGLDISETTQKRVYDYVKLQRLEQYAGGIPTSFHGTGQQWDFPNAWPPLVHLFIQAVNSLRVDGAQDTALSLAHKWLSSNWKAYKKTGYMFEKYQVIGHGQAGGGGEYKVQRGFGWSNGVVLMLLKQFSQNLNPLVITTLDR